MNCPSALGVLLLSAVVLTSLPACDSEAGTPADPADPGGTPRLSVVVVSGVGQRAFTGEYLPEPIVVRVVDDAGQPVAGKRRLAFSVEAGGGSPSDTSVVTDDRGVASVRWRLGDTAGYWQLAARVADAPSSTAAQAVAEVVSRDAADLVVVSGLRSGTVLVLVRKDATVEAHELSWPDTVLQLLPRRPVHDGPAGTLSWQEVVAFSHDHPPFTVLQPFTDGVDTVTLAMRAPVAVPLTVWILAEFEESAARLQTDLRRTAELWEQYMTGLRIGSVRIEHAPEMAGTIDRCSDVPLRSDPDAINLYYTAMSLYRAQALACSPTRILMGRNLPVLHNPAWHALLAHELGHTFGLGHVTDDRNVMHPDPGGRFSVGQIYRMHFHSWGALNSLLGLNPATARNCSLPFSAQCLPDTYDPW